MSALPIWNCEFKEAGTPMANLTVGAKFKLECRGDIETSWAKDVPLKVLFPAKEDEYKLTVLESTKLDSNSVELIVTGYKPGDHKPEYVRIVQGESGFEIAKPQWKIASVLNPQEPPQPPPPFGPWSLSIPVWVWGVIVLTLAIVGLVVFRFVRRYTQRKRMLGELERHRTALSPVNQFYRDARQLKRRLNGARTEEETKAIAADLDREFRLYVLRQFQIPTLEWSTRAIVDDLRRRHRKVYVEAADPLRKTLRELQRLSGQAKPPLKDVEQLHRMSLDTVERIESAKTKRRSAQR